MTTESAELGERLAALRTRLSETGDHAAAAATALAGGIPPDTALLEQLRAVASELAALRDRAVAHAADTGVVPPGDLDSAAAVEALLASVADAKARRERQAAWDAVRADVEIALASVEELTHRDDPAFAPLVAARERAREVAAALPADAPEDIDAETRAALARMQPVADLVALSHGWNALDDERCAALQDSIAQALGRPLAAAALRGKIGRVGEVSVVARSAPSEVDWGLALEDPFAAHAGPPAALDEDVEESPATAAFEPFDAPIDATWAAPPPPPPPPPYGAPPPAGAPPTQEAPAPTPNVRPLPPNLAVPESVMPESTRPPSLGEELRQAASEEPAEAREARRAKLQRLARTSAPWWTAASDAWTRMREARETIEAAIPRTLARFPHLLAVPIQRSADPTSRVAEGYALLLAHVEKQEPGFVADALLRLNPELAGGASEAYDLGPELYSLVVAEGRLYKTYAEFVRAVVAAALPEPGLWLSGRVVEHADCTVIATRPDTPGVHTEETKEIRDSTERFTTHTVTATLAPLTTRVWRLETTPLDDPTDIELKLTANGTPSDSAWIVSIPLGGGPPTPPKRHKVRGTTLPAVGKETGTTWIALFNPDPKAERRYELALALKRQAPPPKTRPAPAPPEAVAPAKPSPFAGRRKPR